MWLRITELNLVIPTGDLSSYQLQLDHRNVRMEEHPHIRSMVAAQGQRLTCGLTINFKTPVSVMLFKYKLTLGQSIN